MNSPMTAFDLFLNSLGAARMPPEKEPQSDVAERLRAVEQSLGIEPAAAPTAQESAPEAESEGGPA